MNNYTPEQQEQIDIINNMSHYEMCKFHRYASLGHIFFDKRLPFSEVFKTRLFDHFGGFTPEISKKLS